MDVANEAYNFQDENPNELMDKSTWRQWMNVFSAGKKVSEQNLVIEEHTEEADEIDKLESIGLSQKNINNPIQML